MVVTIPTPGGGMPGYLSRPGGEGRWPGVVVLHDGFGIDEAVRAQADWLAGAGYLALSVDLGCWGRPAACLLRMFHDLRAGRGQTFGQVDAARAWLAGQPGCDGRLGVIGFCATGGFALLMAAGHGFVRPSLLIVMRVPHGTPLSPRPPSSAVARLAAGSAASSGTGGAVPG